MNEIKKYREEKGYTQEEVARRLGVTQGAVWQWENGKTLPRPATLCELADILGTTVKKLLGKE